MTLQTEKIGHKALVDGGEIILHTHPGGGGPSIKFGTIVMDGSGVGAVVFAVPFADENYVISLTAQDTGDTTIAMYDNKMPEGFGVKTENDKGLDDGNTTVDWVAIHV